MQTWILPYLVVFFFRTHRHLGSFCAHIGHFIYLSGWVYNRETKVTDKREYTAVLDPSWCVSKEIAQRHCTREAPEVASTLLKLQAKGWHSVLLCYRERGKKVTLKQMMLEDPKLEMKFKQQNGLSRLKGLSRIFYKSKAVNFIFIYVFEYIQLQCSIGCVAQGIF